MIDASFFESLALLPDCQAVIQELAERHEVFIVSAAMDVPCSFDAKYQWLRRHFPFIPPTRIVFCGDKSVVDADYLMIGRGTSLTSRGGRCCFRHRTMPQKIDINVSRPGRTCAPSSQISES